MYDRARTFTFRGPKQDSRTELTEKRSNSLWLRLDIVVLIAFSSIHQSSDYVILFSVKSQRIVISNETIRPKTIVRLIILDSFILLMRQKTFLIYGAEAAHERHWAELGSDNANCYDSGKRPPLAEQRKIKADIATINSPHNDRHSSAAWAVGFCFPKNENCVLRSVATHRQKPPQPFLHSV